MTSHKPAQEQHTSGKCYFYCIVKLTNACIEYSSFLFNSFHTLLVLTQEELAEKLRAFTFGIGLGQLGCDTL